MKFKSVTFDLDGTLLDTIADLAEGCRRMLEELGEPPRSPEEIHSFVGKGMAVLVERCLTRGHAPSAEKLHAGIESYVTSTDAATALGTHTAEYTAMSTGMDAATYWRSQV